MAENFVIVIDPGHGGSNEGLNYDGFLEKDMNLVTAKAMQELFLTSFKNTIILWFGNFIPQILLSLLLAVWFTDSKLHIQGVGFFKVVMYLPNIITAASVAALFMRFISNSQLSAINTLLLNAGSDPVSFEASAVWSRGIVMFIQTWLWFGNTMIMMMSGIMGINPSLFEAAAIDGCLYPDHFHDRWFADVRYSVSVSHRCR